MRLQKQLIDRIRKDNAFSLALAYELQVKQLTVDVMARTNARNGRLTKETAISFFKKHGYNDKEIYTN